MMKGAGVLVFDNFLADPERYRAEAIAREYRTYEFPDVGVTFHGISAPAGAEVPLKLARLFPAAVPTLSFFRRSPAGQVEPHFIHTDVDMGDWTALLYLNQGAPEGDGTAFWRYLPTNEIENPAPHLRSREGMTPAPVWRVWRRVDAKFNRLVVFPATYYHSRAIFENWGQGEGARLTQVTFGKGNI